MIIAIILSMLSSVSCDATVSASYVSKLALDVPEYSSHEKFHPGCIFFALALLVVISFINVPRKSLQKFQSPVVVLSGVYLGASHILRSFLPEAIEAVYSILVGLGCVVAAVASLNDELRSLFLASICAYATTYYGVLVFRIESDLKAIGLGTILFFLYLVFGRRADSKLLNSVSKAGVTSLGLVALVDTWTWNNKSLLGGMHGVNGKTGLIYGFSIGGTIILVSFVLVFIANYFPEWSEEKINKLKSEVSGK